MLLVIILLTVFTIIFSGITTIPFSIGLVAICAVLFRKSWVFFLAFAIGLFLDLITMRPLGQASLVLTIFVFLLFLYERKFETGTVVFIFLSTFLGDLFYLWLFGYNQVLVQAFISALVTVVFFRVILNLFQDPTLNKTEMLK
jgi:hypothetical protein